MSVIFKSMSSASVFINSFLGNNLTLKLLSKRIKCKKSQNVASKFDEGRLKETAERICIRLNTHVCISSADYAMNLHVIQSNSSTTVSMSGSALFGQYHLRLAIWSLRTCFSFVHWRRGCGMNNIVHPPPHTHQRLVRKQLCPNILSIY